ncbi:MAG: MFS transporter, partial [Candidatus Nanopelagicales bacterium]
MKEPFQVSRRQRTDLRLLIAGRTTSTLGDEMALIALLIAAYQTGSGAPAIAALLIAGALPAALLAGWAGAWVDRCDSHTLLIAVGVAQTTACAALSLVHWFVAQLALVAILSALQVVSGPAWQALVPHIVGEGQVGRVVGILQSAALIAGLAGAAIGGLIVSAFGVQIALVVDAATFGLLTVAAAAIQTRRRMATSLESPTRIGDGWRALRGDELLAPLMGGLLAFIVVGEAINVVAVLLVTDVLGGGAFALGMLGAVFGLCAAIGAWVASRIQTERSRVNATVASAALLASMTIVAGLSISLGMLSAAWAIAGVSLGILQV